MTRVGKRGRDRMSRAALGVALGMACSPVASLRRELDRADDMEPILGAQRTPTLLELYDHCETRGFDPPLVCLATAEELGQRAVDGLDAQHRGYADHFEWGSSEGWILRGTCDDARAAVEQAGALWQGLERPDRLGLDRAHVADAFRPHHAALLATTLERTSAHADALVACGDGDGLARLLELFAATTAPRWVEVFEPESPSIIGTEAILDDLALRRPRLARWAAARSSAPLLEPLRRGEAPAPCPTDRGVLESMLLSPTAAERVEACECVMLGSSDGLDDGLVTLREQLAAYDSWTGEPLHGETLLRTVASHQPPSPSSGGGHEGPSIPRSAGPLVTGIAGGAVVLGGVLRALGDGGGHREPVDQHEVRRECTSPPLGPERWPRPEPGVHVVGVGETMDVLRVVALVPGGVSWRSKVVVWSVDDTGQPDGGYCSDSNPDVTHPALPRCTTQAKSFLIEPIDGHGRRSSAGASTVVDLRIHDVPRARVVVGVLDADGKVVVSRPSVASELPVTPDE